MFVRFDLFGKPVELNFNGKNKSQTSVGAWFSLIFFGFIGFSIYYLGQDLIYRKEPKTIASETFSENPEPMILSPDTFNFGFGLQHPVTFAHYINESIYTIQVTRDRLIRTVKEDGSLDMKWTNTPVLMEICTKEHFGPLASKFENIELNTLYCLSGNQLELDQVRIQGVFESPIYESLSVMIKQCDNQTSKVSCAPKETLDELLGGGWFATYFTNVAIEPKNYSFPNLQYTDSFYTSISNSYFKQLTLYLSHVEVITDAGWVTSEKKTDRYITLDRPQEYTNFRPNPNEIVNFVIRVGKLTRHYERSYIQVQDVIAKINGLASIGILVCFIILVPYSNLKFYERLVNELFDVKTFHKNKQQRKNTRKHTKAYSNIMVDGDKTEDEEEVKNSSCGTNYQNPHPSSAFNRQQKLLKHPPDHAKIDDSGLSCKNSTLISAVDKKSSPEKKFLKIKINKKEKSQENENNLETRGTDINIELISPSSNPLSSHLFKNKPKVTDKPQVKASETLEIQSSGETLAALEIDIDKINKKPSQGYPDFAKESNHESFYINLDGSKNEDQNPKRRKPEKQPERHIDEIGIIKRAELLPHQLTKDSYHINITFGEYLRSYFWKSNHLKEKFDLLAEGIRRIQERLNIFNLLKKLREIDKLKLLLLEDQQFVLFDALPNPELSLRSNKKNEKRSSFSQLKETIFVAEKRKHDLIKCSYVNLKKKEKLTMIDEKLLEIYDDIIDF